jgi:hypothetical protein
MCSDRQWQKCHAYIRSLQRFQPPRRSTGRTRQYSCHWARLSIRHQRPLKSIEHELVTSDLSLAGMFAEFAGLKDRTPRRVRSYLEAPS